MKVCRKSFDEAFQVWREGKGPSGTLDLFAQKLAEACQEVAGYEVFKSSTLGRYLREERNISDEKAAIIFSAAQQLGVSLRAAHHRPRREIADSELLNLSIVPQQRDDDQTQRANRIEPNQHHRLGLSVTIDHGSRTIFFGRTPNSTKQYKAKLRIMQGTLSIHTAKQNISQENEAQSPHFRGSGERRSLSAMNWVVEDIPKENGTLHADLGEWEGYFSSTDLAAFSVSSDHLEPAEISNRYEDEMAEKITKPAIDDNLIEAIDAQKREVLKGALLEQSAPTYRIASVPLFMDFEDE